MNILHGLIVEGKAEQAIIDLLLKSDRLILNKDNLIQSPQSKFYQVGLSAQKFQRDFLSHDDKVCVHVVLDDPKKKLKLFNVDELIYHVTREEIEAIQLYANPNWKKQYLQFVKANSRKKSKNIDCKPSTFFRREDGLGIKNIKKYEYVYNLWVNNIDGLVRAIKSVKSEMYKKKSIQKCFNGRKKNNNIKYKYLADLLKQ